MAEHISKEANEKIGCASGLRKNVVNKEVYEREIALCKSLSAQNKGGCCWGKCESCGVIPLLYKLHHGRLIDDEKEVGGLKEQMLH